jgi:hypothetical protein
MNVPYLTHIPFVALFLLFVLCFVMTQRRGRER